MKNCIITYSVPSLEPLIVTRILFDVYSDDRYAVASVGEYNVNETFETEGLYKIDYTMEDRDYGAVTWKSPVSANREVIENAKRQEVKNSISKQTVNFSVKYQEDSNKVVVVGTPLRVGDANDYGDYWSEDAIRLMSRKFMAKRSQSRFRTFAYRGWEDYRECLFVF